MMNNAFHIKILKQLLLAHTTILRAPSDEPADLVLALKANVLLRCNGEDAKGLFESAEAGENELKSNPFSFQEVSVTSATLLGENVDIE